MSGCAENEPFVLQVHGNSMAPEFEEGQIVVVEPGQELAEGRFVIAHVDGEYLLRKLVGIGAGWRLEALDASCPAIDLQGASAIRGHVIQRAGRRRREHKNYC